MALRPKLAEPVIVERFWANRQHDAVYVMLSTFHDQNLVDIRRHVMADGKLVPTSRGVAIQISRLPDLGRAIEKAIRKARELGLLDEEAGA